VAIDGVILNDDERMLEDSSVGVRFIGLEVGKVGNVEVEFEVDEEIKSAARVQEYLI